ncbi:hypothetical protein PRIPAC_81022 [Pristionchus pacificus]|uniref:Glycoside hydrolase n=1 Tax=Pristionchus pacificus TaxID=54126 RepID=A0A2A6BE54_PRIPA|nr:hypothetical protein PRIPAC_81022 [Pristionchus pacificus]|eukprot:PDM64175.1 glycoside hydrolase [Pristionchus pacificus]
MAGNVLVRETMKRGMYLFASPSLTSSYLVFISVSVAAPLIHGCYFTNWAVYRPEPAKFTPEKIPVGLCTHIFYAFAAVNIATYEAKLTDSWSDIDLKSMSGVQSLKKKQPGLKTLLSFGGWTESASGIYAKVASDPVKRSKFVKSAWVLANSNGFDGIDLDWEYPDAANKANFVSLIKELKSQSGGKLLTAAVSAGAATINAGYDVPSFEKYVDYLTVMSYDFHFGSEPKIAHQGAYSETIAAMNIWNQKGMPKNKLLMGIGAYGRGWNAQTCALGAAGNGAIAAQAITKEDGYAAYFEIANMGGKTISTPEGAFLEATVNGQKVCIGFDDRNSIFKKTDFIKKNGFAGAFTWTIDFDGPGFPLHNAIKDGLSGGSFAPVPVPIPSATRVPIPIPSATTKKTNPAPIPAPAPSGGKCTHETMRANANKAKYDQCLWGGWQTRDCPPGTIFDPATNNFKRA